MNDHLQSAVDAIVDRFGAESSEFRGDVSLIVPPDDISDVCLALRDEHAFETESPAVKDSATRAAGVIGDRGMIESHRAAV